MTSELHPLEPFLPVGARLLMLGSFPPQRVRWAMDFFYPNLQNDMWRIVGLVFFGDKGYFLTPDAKRFDKERIVRFCEEKGLALYDTAEEIIRLKNNASDNFLQVVREVDLAQLLAAVPTCRAIVTTGQKATDVIVRLTGCAEPPVGGSVEFAYADRMLRFYRMPSSSRAYPKSVEWKWAPTCMTGGCSLRAGCSDRIAGWMKSYCGDLFRCEFFRGKHWFPRIFL